MLPRHRRWKRRSGPSGFLRRCLTEERKRTAKMANRQRGTGSMYRQGTHGTGASSSQPTAWQSTRPPGPKTSGKAEEYLKDKIAAVRTKKFFPGEHTKSPWANSLQPGSSPARTTVPRAFEFRKGGRTTRSRSSVARSLRVHDGDVERVRRWPQGRVGPGLAKKKALAHKLSGGRLYRQAGQVGRQRHNQP